MPPSTRSNRLSAPPDRIYESVSPLAQAQFPPRRQRVYGRTSLGAPLTKKKQGTLTQIGFVNSAKIDDEIAEYEREEKRRKVETPRTRGGLRARPVTGQRNTTMAGSRLRQMMDNTEEREWSVASEQSVETPGAPIQRLDDTPEPSVNGEEPRPKRRRKSRKGIKIGVKIVTIKVESPEQQRQATQPQPRHIQADTQEWGVDRVMDSFQAAPTFEEERDLESHLRIEAEEAEEEERRRNRVIPDSDAESEDDEIVYDSNEEKSEEEEVVAHSHEHVEGAGDVSSARADSDVDLDEIKDSGGRKAGLADDLDELKDSVEEDNGDVDLDLTREIPDSQAESEDEDPEMDVVRDSQHLPTVPTLKQEATIILNSFSAPSSGEPTVQPRLRTDNEPDLVVDSFFVPASPAASSPPILVADSFYHAAKTSSPLPAIATTAAPNLSAVPEEEEDVDIVPSSSAVSISDDLTNVPSMPPPKTPTKPRRTEVPNTGSTGSTISTQSTIRSLTPSSARSKIYTRSPSKTYNRSPLKRLTENNILQGASLDLPRLAQSPSKRSILPALRESQISTQGTPTQRSRISQLSSFVKPEPETQGRKEVVEEEEEEPTIIPDSPTAVRLMTPKAERNDSQYTADTNSPSRQIHSELSAAMNSDPQPQPPSSGRTIRFTGKVVKDSQADSDDDDEEVLVPSSPKPVTPRVVRFQSIPKDIPSSPHIPRSSPANASTDTQASSASKPSIVGAETQMRSQWLGSDGLSSSGANCETQGTTSGLGESQWLGDLLPESLMLDDADLSVPPIIDDDSVWDEFGSRKSSIED